jgi:predicted dehydrogenase
MAINHAECMIINETALKYNVPVFVAYYRRALPGFLKVKDLIENGSIGKVRLIHTQLFKSPTKDEKSGILPWRVDPALSGGGHFFDLASHQLDYFDYLFGPVKKVKSLVLNQGGLYKAEDFVSAEFLYPDDIAGSGIWCFNASDESNRDIIEITGTGGSIRFSTFSFEPIVMVNKSGRQEFINERPEHVQYFLIEKIVNALEGKGTSPSTGISGARTSWVMDQVVAEYYKDKR